MFGGGYTLMENIELSIVTENYDRERLMNNRKLTLNTRSE